MRALCFALVLSVLGCSLHEAALAEPSTHPKSKGPIARRRILGAEVDLSGSVSVLVGEVPPGAEREQFRLLVLDKSGRLLRDSFLGERGSLEFAHSAVSVSGKLALGWVGAENSVIVRQVKGTAAVTKVLLPGDAKDGTLGAFWYLTVSGKPKLVVKKYRPLPDPRSIEEVHQRKTWLYFYDLIKDEPRLSGKACVETDKTKSFGIECVSTGKGIAIWQRVYEPGSLVQTLRVAEWQGSGPLQWVDRYIGNEPLWLAVAPSSGSMCIVQEWKTPQEGAGFISCVHKDTDQLHLVGTYERVPTTVKLARIERYGAWAIARNSGKGVVVDLLDDTCSLVESVRLEEKRVADLAFATSREHICVVLVRPDSTEVRWLRPKRMRPRATRPSK